LAIKRQRSAVDSLAPKVNVLWLKRAKVGTPVWASDFKDCFFVFMLDLSRLELTTLFPMPLMKYLWADSEDLNNSLMQLILSKEMEDSGILTTNVGGWHSKKNFQSWNSESVRILLNRMLLLGTAMLEQVTDCTNPEMFADWTVQAWANINRFGHYNEFHHHIRNLNLWSGVYYVATGMEHVDIRSEARIVFQDQHRVIPRGRDEFGEKVCVEPEPGLMLLFPSALAHSVERHQGNGDRITVAFNLKNERFTTLNYEFEKARDLKKKPPRQ
jgi:uncharacterized protein (TIGR02466 family)